MGAPYSQDLRDRVLGAYDRGMKTKVISQTFAVSPAWARRVKQRRRDHGETTPRQAGSPGVRIIDRDALAGFVQEKPDATLAELRDRLGVVCTIAAISKVLIMMGYTYKKKTIHATEQDREDVAKRRRLWKRVQHKVDAKRLIFLDETVLYMGKDEHDPASWARTKGASGTG